MFFKKNKKRSTRRVATFLESGFHGDIYLQKLVDVLLRECEYFIETGTNVGSTLAYVARSYPDISCVSCEPHSGSYLQAIKNTEKYSNVKIFNKTSQEFIEIIQTMNFSNEIALFWLDAHGYGFQWPLKDEIKYITTFFKKAHVLIDDFKVPEKNMFKWDSYLGQNCSYEYIKDAINSDKNISFYYPAYTEKTSEFHDLTGWGLLSFGCDEVHFPLDLKDKIEKKI